MLRSSHAENPAGYTLIEALVVLAIIAAVTAVGFSVVEANKRARFDSATQSLLSDLRDLQGRARAVDANQDYGVSFASGSWTTFSRNPATGAVTNLATKSSEFGLTWTITPSASNVRFERLTGRTATNTTASITLTMTNPPQTKTLRVEPTGVLYAQ